MKLGTAINAKGQRIHHFYCPGCKCHHGFNDTWTFDGSMKSPTVSPSLLTTGGADNQTCHLFIKNGKLEFLSDCTHEFAGQIIDMEEVEA